MFAAVVLSLLSFVAVPSLVAVPALDDARMPSDAKLYIEPTENGMHTALAGALRKK
jgi:hypothetical protein